MVKEIFSRTAMLMGEKAIDLLAHKRVAVFGVGGVGGYAVEVMARSGVGHLTLVDNDKVTTSNINRQIIALHSTVGRLKVDVVAERVKDIHPDCHVEKKAMFYLPENANDIELGGYDFVLDAIDTVTAKLDLIKRCHELGVPILSCMGAANKLDPTGFRVVDINKTQADPLAKVIRKKLRSWGIRGQKVVFSQELPLKTSIVDETTEKRIPASNAFVPAAAGIVAGSYVVKVLAGIEAIEKKERGKQ